MIKKAPIKEGLLLLGSFGIACDAATILHELSHGLTAVLTGGQFVSIVINPFSWSYSLSATTHTLVHLLAGAGGAILVGVLLFGILYRWARPWLLAVLLIGPIALLDNGAYYAIDIIMRSGGDACNLINQGIPAGVSVTAGIVCMAAGFVLAVLLIHKLRMLRYGFGGRLAVLSIGILPMSAGMLLWNGIYNRSEIGLWAVYSGATALLTVLFAAIPARLYQKETTPAASLRWKPVIGVNAGYAGLLIFLLAGPFSAPAFPKPETYKERPADFPAVMAAPPFATDVSYRRSTAYPNLHSQWLSYDFPDSISPEKIRNYLMQLHLAHGYYLPKTSIQDPNEVLDDSWIDEDEEIYGIPTTSKHYKQFWIKIGTQPLKSFVSVCYVWKKGQFDTAFVIEVVYPDTDYESLYDYVRQRPEEFDPNAIEQLKARWEVEHDMNVDTKQTE